MQVLLEKSQVQGHEFLFSVQSWTYKFLFMWKIRLFQELAFHRTLPFDVRDKFVSTMKNFVTVASIKLSEMEENLADMRQRVSGTKKIISKKSSAYSIPIHLSSENWMSLLPVRGKKLSLHRGICNWTEEATGIE